MTNIEKALTLINTFATGDTEKAVSLLAEGYAACRNDAADCYDCHC